MSDAWLTSSTTAPDRLLRVFGLALLAQTPSLEAGAQSALHPQGRTEADSLSLEPAA